jgi:hypothetical protein
MVASRIVDGILDDHPRLRRVWWLPVDLDEDHQLTENFGRLRQVLEYHGEWPETYIWFITETRDQLARYLITDRSVDTELLDRYWRERYNGLETRQFQLDQKTLRREVAAHCGRVTVDVGRRMGSSMNLPGVSPRRRSAGQQSSPGHDLAYSHV